MKRARTILAALLALSLLLCGAVGFADAAEEEIYSHLGETLDDFTVSTIDGGTFTLSEALAEKDMVLINLWATWCGPCRMEFPYMEEAYEQYADRVEIIALSVEPTDTVEVLQEFATEYGMTFPVGSDTETDLGSVFATVGIPTTLVVDRFGAIAYIEIGAMPSADAFERLFQAFIGDDYTETIVLETIPQALPTVEASTSEEIGAALNAEGGSIVFTAVDDPYDWPMVPVEQDGRSAMATTNAGQNESASSVLAHISAEEGDALAFTFCTSTEAAMDLLNVYIDDTWVKSFGGEHDWTEWAIALEPGEHDVLFTYEKDEYGNEGDDIVLLDEIAVLSGEEAAQRLAALPLPPTGEEFAIAIVSEGAKEIVFTGADADALFDYTLCGSYWILDTDEAVALVTLTADIDPEAAFGYSNYDGLIQPLTDLTEGGYRLVSGVDSVETTGYSYSTLYVYPSLYADYTEIIAAQFYPDEANVNAYIEEMASAGLELGWEYADGTAPSTTEVAVEGGSADSAYTVSFVDQDGKPVPGCVINFCTDETCVPVIADENGIATFNGVPYAYHLQVIRVPEGYTFDTTQEFTADPEGGELEFLVSKG